MSRAGAERALDLLNLVLREKHNDHCGGQCRVDLDGFPHDCCYACNLAQEIGELYERRAKDFMWADDEVQRDREAYAKAWGPGVAHGQTRASADGQEGICVFGSYGFGSGGLLFSVSFPHDVTRPVEGMSEQESATRYPVVVLETSPSDEAIVGRLIESKTGPDTPMVGHKARSGGDQ